MKIPELSIKEKEQAKQWRIKKCGWDSFDSLFELFKLNMNKKERSDNHDKRDDTKNMEDIR